MADEQDYEGFRREARTWLTEHAVLRANGRAGDGREGDEYTADLVTEARAFQCKLHEAGFAGLTWPADAGGRGLDARFEVVFQQEASDYLLPTSVFNVGTGMCGPTIAAHGTQQQKERWLGAILSGEDVWCQLFSEPDAGSDLASVRSRARRVEGGWHVDGQKIWTSHGRWSDFGLALLRSDPDAPKHKGLIMVVIDMRSPGVDVRPLKQMSGLSKFDQVFFDSVFVPDDCVVGEPGEGWKIARTTLSNERVAVGGNTALRGGTIAQVIVDADRYGRLDDSVYRQRIASAWVDETVIMLMRERVRRAVLDGRAPGPEGALTKLASSSFVRKLASLGLAAGGRDSLAWEDGNERAGEWAARTLAAPGLAVGGGTDEIVSTIVAERVLGLPREPRMQAESTSNGADR